MKAKLVDNPECTMISVRMTKLTKDRIKFLVRGKKYINLSDFVRQAIESRLIYEGL